MDALRQQAAKAAAAYREWTALQGRAAAGLATAANILARLPALQGDGDGDSGGHLAALGCSPEVAREVVGKQLQAFDSALAGVHAALSQMAGAVRELERAALEAGKRAAGMPLAAATQRRGPEPSVAEVVEALQDAWRMCQDELLLKQSAVGLIRLDIPPEDTAAITQCFEAQPNIDAARLEVFFQQMAETAPRKPP